MKKRLRLIFSFYRTFCAFTGMISIVSWATVSFLHGENFWRFLPLYIVMKILTDSLVWYYVKKYNPDGMFFYSNLGISETRLFLSAFSLDVFIFFLLITTITGIIL